jgi:beta-N-acetylhexosaminidase
VGSELRRLGWIPALLIVGAGVIAAFVSLQAVGGESGAAPEQVAATVPAKPKPTPAPTPSSTPRPQHGPKLAEPPAGGSVVATGDDGLPVETDAAAPVAAAPTRPRTTTPSIRRAVGRKIMTGFAGTYPSSALLDRVRRGEVGGVILFGENVTGRLGAAVSALQQAAQSGGNPPLLIATDQEGGEVKRLPSAPPAVAPASMATAAAASQGQATGRALAQRGINVDLAPVADVDHGSFLGSRSFGSSPGRVAAAACGFAAGLQSAGVHATLKHFPGLGRTARNTDQFAVSVTASPAALGADLEPYRQCAPSTRLVMLSNATYPAFDPSGPAVFSRTIVHDLLRGQLGFRGVTISDTLAAPGVASPSTAVRASRAGVDMLLYTDEAMSARAYGNVLAAVRTGQLSRSSVLASARRIRALTR